MDIDRPALKLPAPLTLILGKPKTGRKPHAAEPHHGRRTVPEKPLRAPRSAIRGANSAVRRHLVRALCRADVGADAAL